MSEVNVKEGVRNRDGRACRDCGMSEAEHLQEFERTLDVHRLIPGSEYNADSCVTLCRSCHSKKPSKIVQLFSGTRESDRIAEHSPDDYEAHWKALGVMVIYFNYYNADDRRRVLELMHASDVNDIPFSQLLDQVLDAGLKAVLPCLQMEIRKPPRLSFDLSDAA